MRSEKLAGVFCGIMTGVFWGLSGVFSQYLFTNTDMQSDWFVAVRMLVSGFCILIFSLITKGDEIRRLMQNGRDLCRCILAGVLGTMCFQFACYGAVQRSNAATAIVLQYLCPVMVMIYVCVKKHRLPEKLETLSLMLAIAGIFLISTHGNIHELVMSKEALTWGVGCAFFMMLGTILPEPLYERYSAQTVTALALFFGGLVAGITINPIKNSVPLDGRAMVVLGLAIIFGSIIAYVVYGFAVKQIGSARASLFACAEIPTATVLSVLFMGSRFTCMDLIGFAMIGSTIFILSAKK